MIANRHSTRRTAASLALLLALAVAFATTGCSAGIALAIIELTKSSGGGGKGSSTNQAPSVQVGSIERTDGMVQIPIRPFDSDNTTVNINVTYDIGGGPVGATISQTVLPADEFGTVETIVEWDAKTDFGGSTAYVGSIQLQITPDDGTDSGPAVFPATFAFGNDAPVVTSCVVDTDGGEVSGITAIRFIITDTSSDLCDVTKIEFSEDGTFTDTVIDIPLDTGVGEEFPTGSLTALTSTGVEHSVSWDTTLTANINSTASKIRITVIDDPGADTTAITSAAEESNDFAMANIDQNEPFASLQGIKRADAGGLRTGAISIDYILFDPEKDPVDIQVEYSTNEKATWSTCTEYPSYDSEGRYELQSDDEDGIVHRFVWDAAADLFTYFDTVHIRVIPAAVDGVGPPAETFIEISVGQDAFDATATHNLAGPCKGVATGDLGSDGLIDAVVSNGGAASSVTPLICDENGVLTPGADIAVPGSPQELVMARLDADSQLDVAVCTPLSNTVSVLLNSGGTLLPPVTYATGDLAPRNIVAGDFNDDTILDLVVANGGSDTISLLVGVGNGTFLAAVTFQVGSNPGGMQVVDYNDDGYPDVAVCNEGDDTVSLMECDGAGVFVEVQTIGVGTAPRDVVRGDFNLDGQPDLAVASSDTNVEILFHNGTDFSSPFALAIGAAAVSLVAGDFNEDFRTDLLAIREGVGDLAFLLTNPTGGPPTLVSYFGVTQPFSGATADFNRDGTLDLIVVADRTFGANVGILNSAREGATAPNTVVGVGTDPVGLVVADINRDGAVDVITSHANDDYIEVNVGGGNGRFEFSDAIDAQLGSPGAMAAADFDQDVFLDLVVLDSTGDDLRVLTGDGEGSFSRGDLFLTGPSDGTQEQPSAVVAADFDGDLLLDLIVANRNTNNVVFLKGVGDGTFEAADAGSTFATGNQPTDLAMGDFNKDGVMDIAVTCFGSDQVRILFNDGLAAFTEFPIFAATASGPVALVAAHLDADSHLDLAVVCDSLPAKVSVLRGLGNGQFSRDDIDGVNGPTDIVAADFNRDGYIDLAVCGTTIDVVGVLVATASGGFRPSVPLLVSSDPTTLATGDFDSDGVIDLAATSNGANVVSVLIGRRTRARWWRDLGNFNPGTGSGNVVGGAATKDTSNDHFGNPRQLFIGQRTFNGTGDDGADDYRDGAGVQTNDFQLLLRHKFGASLPTMEALTRPWKVSGDVRLHAEEDLTGTDTGKRIRPLNRFGTRNVPGDNLDLTRDGLDVQSSQFLSQRGIVVELPIRTSRTQAVIQAAVSSGKIHVYARYTDWRRADAVPEDPSNGDLGADLLLPRIPDGGGGYRGHYEEVYTFESIAWASPGNDLADDQAGRRFIVDYSNSGNPRVRVLTDRLGVFQAFYEP